MSLNHGRTSRRGSRRPGAPVCMLNLRMTATRRLGRRRAAVTVGEIEDAVGDVAAERLVQDERRRQVVARLAGILHADPARRVDRPVVVEERDPGVVGLDVLRRRRGSARRSGRARDRRSSSPPSRSAPYTLTFEDIASKLPSAAGLIGRPSRLPTKKGCGCCSASKAPAARPPAKSAAPARRVVLGIMRQRYCIARAPTADLQGMAYNDESANS